MIETEVKIRLSEEEFNLFHEQFGSPDFVFQRNWGYFTPNGYARVREEGDKRYITLKKNTFGDNFSREEIEFEISDFSSAREMFNGLGFFDEHYYEKRRAVLKRNGATICLDHVLNLGYFIEVEGEEKQISTTLNELGLNLKKREEKSYFEMVRRENVSIDSSHS